MDFCNKCGTMMTLDKKSKAGRLSCPACGATKKNESGTMVIKEKIECETIAKASDDKKIDTMPKVKADCRSCGNKEAYYRSEQTRAADEPETEFFTCTKCGKVWREYQ